MTDFGPLTDLDEELSPDVVAARDEIQNPRLLSDRIAIGRALWRDLVIGFAAQLGRLGVGFTQLAALYAIGGVQTLTITDLAEQIGRSHSATSRLVGQLERRGRAGRQRRAGRAGRWNGRRRDLLGVANGAHDRLRAHARGRCRFDRGRPRQHDGGQPGRLPTLILSLIHI